MTECPAGDAFPRTSIPGRTAAPPKTSSCTLAILQSWSAPRLDRPVNVVITWTDRAATELGTDIALRIAAAFDIPVLNLATVSPRAACERLRDIALDPPPTLSPVESCERLRDVALKPTPFVPES